MLCRLHAQIIPSVLDDLRVHTKSIFGAMSDLGMAGNQL